MKYSFIVLTYNSASTIINCLDSIYQQEYKKFEVLVIDDGSFDSTLSLLDKKKSIYPNLKIFKREKSGISSSRNFGIIHSKGDYILFIDSDDTIVNGSLNIINNELIKEKVDLLKCRVNCIDKKKYDFRFECPLFGTIKGKNALLLFCESNKIFATPWSYVINKDMFMKNKFQFAEDTLHEDYGIMPIIIYNAKKIKSTNIDFYNYIKSNNSTVSNNLLNNEISRMNDFLIHTYNLLNYFSLKCKKVDEKKIVINYFLERLNIKYNHLNMTIKNCINNYLYESIYDYKNIEYRDKISLDIEKKFFDYNFENFPIKYEVNIKLVVKLAKQIFDNELKSVILGGSAGKNKAIVGWSDLDIYIILKKYSFSKVKSFENKLIKFNLHIGVTYYSVLEVEKNMIDNKTKIMIYEKTNYNVNPTLYGKNCFNNVSYIEIVKNDISNIPNIVHEFRRMNISILNNKDLFNKKYLKKLLVLIKCFLNSKEIFTYCYVDAIDNFINIVNNSRYLTKYLEFDIIHEINNYEMEMNKIIEFGKIATDFIIEEMEKQIWIKE